MTSKESKNLVRATIRMLEAELKMHEDNLIALLRMDESLTTFERVTKFKEDERRVELLDRLAKIRFGDIVPTLEDSHINYFKG